MADRTPLDTRTHSIWLSQLLLGIVVVVVVLLVQTLTPETLNHLTFTIGVSMIVVITAVALALPWQNLPPLAVLVVPLLDIVAVGIMTHDTTQALAFLWLFPVTWIASHFPLGATGTALGTVIVMIGLEEIQHPEDSSGTLRLVVVALSLSFIAISTQLAARQTRAFKRLLRREANKLNETLIRSTRQERELSRMLGTLDVGVVRLSASGEILEANPAYRTLYDINPADTTFAARSVEYDDYRGSPLTNPERPIMRARGGKQFDDVRTWLFSADGSWRALSLTSLRLADDRGLASGESLLIAHDITAMVSAERARDSLATRVSHELRNPLTTVIGYSDLVLEDGSIGPRVRERIEAINSAAERMMTLAGQMLGAGRHAQLEEAAMSTTDLAKVVSDSVDSFVPTAEASGVHLTFAADPDVFVQGDAFRLRQVSDNLVSNAVKYTPKGGRVTVEVFVAADAEPDIAADPSGRPLAVLRISDTGMGMEPDEVARIFEPYFRSAAAQASTIIGTGLGMGIVQSLVAQHDGSLDVRSMPGRGTTVTVTIPADRIGLDDDPAIEFDHPGLTVEDPQGRTTTDA
ncbi:sensor histidine kinase [Microbacterium rhizomatis]|nr:PAS domain-containing sensor histidine kinase [Microbacterium rhizomatis]